MADVFISYSAQDRNRVRPLVDLLAKEGWSVWWDRELVAGPSFEREIDQALTDASCIVVAWSRDSVESRWCRAEATEGLERGVLVPLALDDVRVPLSFRGAHTAAMYGWPGVRGEVDSVLGGIRRLVGPEASNPARGVDTPPADTRSEDWRWPLVAALVAAGLVAAAAWFALRPPTAPGAGKTVDRSVVVEPFVASGETAQLRTIAAGFSRELTGVLSGFPELHVLQNPSGGTPAPGYLVQGVLIGADPAELRIDLVRTAGAQIVWSDTFTLPDQDPTTVINPIARAVRFRLTLDQQCYGLVLKARTHLAADAACRALDEDAKLNQGGEYDATLQAASARRAVELDPTLADAWGLLGTALSFNPAQAPGFEGAHEAVARGLALDPDNPGLLFRRAMVHMATRDFDAAQADFQASLANDPLHPYARWNHAGLGQITLSRGDAGGAVEHYRRAARLYDADGRVQFEYLTALVCARRFAEASAVAERVFELLPQGFYHVAAAANVIIAYHALGQDDAANALLEQTFATSTPEGRARLINSFALLGHTARARALLDSPGEQFIRPTDRALAHAALGDIDAAFAAVWQIIENGGALQTYLLVHPTLDPLRTDPRWHSVEAALRTSLRGQPPSRD